MNFSTIFYLIENYKSAYEILKSKHPNNVEEIKKLLDKHQKLKDLRRLKQSDINIDILIKQGFDYFKKIMDSYNDDLLKTKKDILENLDIFDFNDEYIIIKVRNQRECYILSHGKAHWCISANDEDAEYWYNYYTKNAQLYIAIKRNQKGDDKDILAILKSKNNIEVKDKNDEYVDFYMVNIPHEKISQDII